MKTIRTVLLMVALICATVHRHKKVAAVELNLPGLATVRIELHREGDNATTAVEDKPTGAEKGESETTPSDVGKNESGENRTEKTQSIPDPEKPANEEEPTAQDLKPTEAPAKNTDSEKSQTDPGPGNQNKDMSANDEPTAAPEDLKSAKSEVTSAPAADKVGKPQEQTEALPEKSQVTPGPDETQPPAKPDPAKTVPTTPEGPKSQAKVTAAPSSTEQEKPATEEAPKPPKDQQDDEESASQDEDNFDDDDIWGDIEDPPEEFGREDDLDPALTGEKRDDACLDGLFQPKLELPAPLMLDMYHTPLQDAPESQKAPEGPTEPGFFRSLMAQITTRLNPSNVLQQLDSLPGTIQSLTDVFRQKKADAVRSVRERMDAVSAGLGQSIQEDLAGRNACTPEGRNCLDELKRSFDGYEELLQQSIRPCLWHAQQVVRNHEQRVQKAVQDSQDKLRELQECKANSDSSSIGSMFKAIVKKVKCTTASLQRQMRDAVQPLLKRFMNLVKHQGDHLQDKLPESGDCVDSRVHQDRFEKRRQQLLTKGKQCLTKQ